MSPRKAIKTSLIIALVSGFVSLSPLIAPVPRAEEASQQPGVSEDAATALARMGKTLQAEEFSFVSRTLRAYAGPNGELLHIAHTTKTIFRRPDRLLVDVTGDDGSIKMLYDGKTFVLYAVEQKKYASVAISGDIDSALDEIQDRTGTDFPLADFLSTDPAKSLLSGVTAGGQVGTATIGGVPCRHFFFMQAPDMELEFWLEDNERSLPRRLIVTYLSLPGRPNFIAELSDWKLSIQTPDSEFEFRPPAGVSQVELASKAEHAPSPPK